MNTPYLSAKSETKFQAMRRQAFLHHVMHFLQGQPDTLLPFEPIRAGLHLRHSRSLGIQNIEVDKIVGSMGRYEDFTREFLPRREDQRNRWRRIYDLTNSQEGFPPIEVFKVDDVYFVRDGNHRVSVARANGNKTIEAHVSEYLSPVPLTPDDTLDDILIKMGEANFLKETNLDNLHPDHHIRLTNPGRYRLLLEHIAVHKYLKEVECGCELPHEAAVSSWYKTVYCPLVEKIREHTILKQFPGRTEADLYTWLVLHRGALEKMYGLGQVDDEQVVEDLEKQGSHNSFRWVEQALRNHLRAPAALPPVE